MNKYDLLVKRVSYDHFEITAESEIEARAILKEYQSVSVNLLKLEGRKLNKISNLNKSQAKKIINAIYL